MSGILSLFNVLYPHLSMTQFRQFSCVVSGPPCDDETCVDAEPIALYLRRGSYRTIQRFFNTLLPYRRISWIFLRRFQWEKHL